LIQLDLATITNLASSDGGSKTINKFGFVKLNNIMTI